MGGAADHLRRLDAGVSVALRPEPRLWVSLVAEHARRDGAGRVEGDKVAALQPRVEGLGLGHQLGLVLDEWQHRRLDGREARVEAQQPVREVRAAVKGLLFHTAICLHEDYDAQGAYLYDLNRTGSDATGRALLAKATNKRLPIDGRKRIDGRKAKDGVLYRQRLDMRNIPGLPEAVFFYVNKLAERTLTFETPSEFALTDRIDAHRRFLTAAARACC